MKPYIKHINKPSGGSTEALMYSWEFMRKSLADSKRKKRRNKRRSDKLDLQNETLCD